MYPSLNRRFWNPVLALSGGLLLVSGLFLFFHLKSRTVVMIHEWVGIVFLVACAVHLVLNSKALIKTLGGRAVAWSLLIGFLLAGLGMACSDIKTGHKHRHGNAGGQEINARDRY